ncbi:MAG: aldolase catalytic domain-containing protein [Victivallales bacterium]|nr:aldolase catalytic domain-containing protein [Victivallales bacterium]
MKMGKEEVLVVDCSVRDGGLINKWYFSDEVVRNVFKAVNSSGIDYMEIGYRASEKMFPPEEYGPWRFSKDDKVREIIGETTLNTKLGVMVDIGRVEPEDFLPADESPLCFVRVATYLKDIEKAVALANLISEKGYEAFINIMAISTVNDFDLAKGLKLIDEETDVKAVTVVDSFGSLYEDNVVHLVELFKSNLNKKKVGFHGHNNLQLGFANTLVALKAGALFCDATITGIGRGAGNCPLELLLSAMKNPKFNIEPIFQVIQGTFNDLAKQIEWGYILPYMITGMLNEHPRVAIALRSSPQRDNCADFYRQLTTPECVEDMAGKKSGC